MTQFHAVVLAGDRGGPDDLLRAAGVDAKVMAPIAGTPMIERVLATIAESPTIAGGCICGPAREVIDRHPPISRSIRAAGLEWRPPATGPAASTVAALTHLDRWPVLVTTADHALLTPAIVDHFCTAAIAHGADMVVGLARHADVMAEFPGTRRTALRFADDHYCGCNLFAFLGPDAIGVARFWERVERNRKRPWRLFGSLGLASVVAYLLGRLSLEESLSRLSMRVGCTVRASVLPFPAAAVDVDSAADWRLVNTLVSGH